MIDIELDDREVREALAKLQQRLADMTPAMKAIATELEARVGFGADYAIMHQFGAKKGEYGTGSYKKRRGSFPIPWGDVPARPMLPITRDRRFYGEDRDVVLNILSEFLNGGRSR